MQKVLLYYKFVPIADPDVTRLWQKALCEKLNLRGRILIADKGINGTVGGDIEDLKTYVKQIRTFEPFKSMQFKWSDGGRDDFPKLSIKVRPEIVSFGAGDELQVDDTGVVGGGKYLKPEQVHQLVAKKGDDVVFFDGRNAFEAKVGRFKGAIVPDTRTSKDFISEIESGKYDGIKDKPVVTYCTGGIRCEILSVLMKNRGFKEVYQMDGGIVKYGETYGDDGLWEGSLYVFDDRMGMKFSDHTVDIGECIHCAGKTSNYENCALKSCNDLVLICEDCKQEPAKLYHSQACYNSSQVPTR